MPVPADNSLGNLSTTPGSNSPGGGENLSTADDYLRFIQAALKAGLTNSGDAITTASSVTVPSAGLTARLTGNGTVTALTGAYDGRLLMLQIEGAITFTHSSSLQCPNGVSLSVAAGDLVLAERRLSVWYLYNAGQTVAAALAAETTARAAADTAEATTRAAADTSLQNQINALSRGIGGAYGTATVPGNQTNTVIPLPTVTGAEWTAVSNGMRCEVAGSYEIRAQVIQSVDVANQGDQGYYSVMITDNGNVIAEDILVLHNNCNLTITPICHRIAIGVEYGHIINVVARGRYQGGGAATCYVQARRW